MQYFTGAGAGAADFEKVKKGALADFDARKKGADADSDGKGKSTGAGEGGVADLNEQQRLESEIEVM